MELRVLRYYLMAAREENITRAAELLHVTQPTLSRQLMQLEEELGVKLFRRGGHSITLTDEGMLLKRRAQELIALADKTKKELLCDAEPLSGEIGIGCGELLSMSELADIMAAFRRQYPLVQYNLFSSNSDGIKERIEHGTLDIGLLLEPVDIGRYAFVRMNSREEWGVLVREDSPLARLESVSPNDLAGAPLYMTSRYAVRHEIDSWLGECADYIDRTISFNLLYNCAVVVQRSGGAAVCLRLNCSYDSLRFVPLSPRIETGSVLAWKEHQTLSPAVSAFIRFAKQYISGISQDLI